MSATINNVYIQTFERNLRQLAQQEITRLRPFVITRAVGGINHNWERLASEEASIKTSRAQPTPIADFEFSRRVSVAKTYDIGELVEQEDQVQAAVQLNSNLTMAMGFAMRRAFDTEIITQLGGDALDGTGAPVVFPPAQVVGDGTAPISFDMVTEVQEKFLENDITPDIGKCFVVGPTQIRKLMQLTEQTSSDYVQREALQRLSATGIVIGWMGFTWICSTLLQAPDTDELDCFAFTPRGLGLQINKDITANIAQDPSRSFAWSLYAHSVFGAVRVEDEHVVKVHVADTL